MLPQRTDLIYQNYLIDIAKLYDIAAIYGPLSPDQVRKLFLAVFESDNRYLSDFSTSVDMMISLLKKGFAAALRVTEMINGESVQHRAQHEQDEIIKRLLLDLSEILTTIQLSTGYFPDAVLESLRNTPFPLFMANVWSLMHTQAKKWLRQCVIADEL